jgi:autoinducer 2 (AI-2) kinase
MTANASLLLAIDVGTGSCRAVLFDASGGQVAIGQREWSHDAVPGVPGSQVFDTETNWRLICDCTHEALATAGVLPDAVAAVSATSIREGMVLYDAGGHEIWACPNVDSRGIAEARELVESGAARDIYALGGDWVSITMPARFLWLRKHQPEVFAAIAHVGMLSDWILYRLCGRFVTDPSAGSSSGMFKLAERRWSQEVLEICGLNPTVFPDIFESGTVIGQIEPRAAAETGLAAGTPVVIGGADTQMGLVGIGGLAPGRMTIVGGSFWQTTALLDRSLIDPECRLRTLCHSVPGQWMVEGIGFYSGLTMRWFRDAFCQYEKAAAAIEGVDVYTVLEREAAAVPPGANGVIGVFSNIMDAKRWVHASPAFLQFDIDHPESSGKSECFRAVQESAVFTAYGHKRIIEQLTSHHFDEVLFTGGASRGGLWPRILADVLGATIQIPVVKESTALGAALYAGLGVGLYEDLDEAVRGSVKLERTLEPDAATHEQYQSLYERWTQVYSRMLELSEEGLLRPLWRAAGTSARDPGATATIGRKP